jgi:hypothetical protein
MRVATTPVLIGLNLVLAAAIAALWIDPQGGLRGTHWQAPAAVRPDLGAAPAVSASQDDADTSRFVAILDRPLFSTTRRPAPVVAKGDSGRADPLDGLHLYGVFSGPEGGGIIARVDGKSRRVKVSEPLGDWNLKEIRGQQAVFVRGAETRFVALVQARQGASLAGAPASGSGTAAQTDAAAMFRRRPLVIRTLPQLAAPAPAPAPAPARAATPPSPAPAPAAPVKPAPSPSPAAKPPAASSSASPFVIGGSR